jgi:ABC-type lipoprotein export system ATPase subunit
MKADMGAPGVHLRRAGQLTYVLRRINGEIKEGEFVTIMGPSGHPGSGRRR